MKRVGCWIVGVAVMLMSWTTTATAAVLSRDADKAAHDVLWRLDARDCAGAVRALNAGIAKGYAEVVVLAGGMYDEGICVKRDWDRAVDYYLQAREGGHWAARYRLVSGYAAPAGGPDMAAALWWAHQRPATPVAECAVADGAKDDPDRFVAELRAWPAHKLAVCNYIVGVLASLYGDIQYPDAAILHAVAGKVKIRFVPAIPRVEITSSDNEAIFVGGVVSGDMLAQRNTKAVTGSLEEAVRNSATRALKRYPQPAGIDPSLTFDMEFVFNMTVK